MAFENSQKSPHLERATKETLELEAKDDQHGNLEEYPPPTLTPDHREYLIKRHGTFSLDPLPSSDPADPYNWPAWKVYTLTLSTYSLLTTTAEKYQHNPGVLSSFHDDLLRCRHHSCIRKHCHGPRRLHSKDIILSFCPDHCDWNRPIVLETDIRSLRTTAGLACQYVMQWTL